MRGTVAWVVAAVALGVFAGCGGGEESAIDLTKRLPPGADFYVATSLADLREGLGLPDDASPLDEGVDRSFAELGGGTFSIISDVAFREPELFQALDLGAVSAAASAAGGDTGGSVSVLATSASRDDLANALLDAGFSDDDGTFTRDDAPGFRLEDGLVYLAADAEDLEGIPDEPADDVPAPILDGLDGVSFTAVVAPSDCVSAYGTSATADGSGDLVIEVDGEPDLDRLTLEDSDGLTFGDPDVDGNMITVPVESDEEGVPAAERALVIFLAVYDCD